MKKVLVEHLEQPYRPLLYLLTSAIVFKDASARLLEIWPGGVVSSIADWFPFLLLILGAVWTAVAGFRLSQIPLRRRHFLGWGSIFLALYWIFFLVREIQGGYLNFSGLAALGFGVLALLLSTNLRMVALWARDFSRSYLVSSLILGTVVAVSGVGGENYGLNLMSDEAPFRGLASHPNVLGAVVATGTVLELTLSRKKAAWFWSILFVATLLATGSVGSSVALAAAVTVNGALDLHDSSNKSAGVFSISAAAVMALALILFMGTQGRLNSLESFGTGRLAIWQAVTPQSFPSMVWGDGFALIAEVPGGHAHNDFVQALSVTGIIGVLLLGGAVTARLVELYRSRFSRPSLLLPIFAFTVVLGLVETPLAPSFSASLPVVILIFFTDLGGSNAQKPLLRSFLK